MSDDQIIVWYKILRLGLLVGALYVIVWYLWFSRNGKTIEEPARRIFQDEED